MLPSKNPLVGSAAMHQQKYEETLSLQQIKEKCEGNICCACALRACVCVSVSEWGGGCFG